MPKPKLASGPSNLCLDTLDAACRGRLKPGAQMVELKRGRTLYEAGDRIRHVYFPLTCVVSLLGSLRDGSMVEAAVVGREGSIGLVSLVGSGQAVARSIVQIGGRALTLDARKMRAELERNTASYRPVFRYYETIFIALQQSVVCSAKHSTTQRLCRWLLDMRDRISGDSMPFTHEFLAEFLGANRATVSAALSALRKDALVDTRRGSVAIVDRERMARVACECYRIVQRRSEKVRKKL